MSAWHEVGQWVVMIDKDHSAFWLKGVVREIIGKHAIVDFRVAGHFAVDCRFDQLEVYRGLKHDICAHLPAEQPAPEPEPRGAVADVQCRCGYMASQHWADGECPGDGYPYDDAPENHMHTHEDGELFLQSLAARDQEVVALQAALEAERARVRALEAKLRVIADSQYTQYVGSSEYSKGVTDGHRYCAQVARDALAKDASANGGGE